jgi:hypothetical protein
MKKNQKNALVYLSGGIGVVVLLGGIFGIYDFRYGLIGFILLIIIANAINMYYKD